MICIDSNIVIYAAEPGFDILQNYLQNTTLALSKISKIEVLGYHLLSKKEKDYFIAFFSRCQFLEVTGFIINKAISLRQQKKMSLGDAIIAATAIQEEIPLLTANSNDFKHIKELDLMAMSDIQNQPHRRS